MKTRLRIAVMEIVFLHVYSGHSLIPWLWTSPTIQHGGSLPYRMIFFYPLWHFSWGLLASFCLGIPCHRVKVYDATARKLLGCLAGGVPALEGLPWNWQLWKFDSVGIRFDPVCFHTGKMTLQGALPNGILCAAHGMRKSDPAFKSTFDSQMQG